MEITVLEEPVEVVQQSVRVASQNGRTVLVSCTRPWPAESLIEFLEPAAGAPRVYWENGAASVGFAGYGAAAVLTAAGPDRFQTIRKGVAQLFENAVLETVDVPSIVGPRLFGGFSFEAEHRASGLWSAFPAAYFVLPRYQLACFEGRHWLTVNRLVRTDEEATLDGEIQQLYARTHDCANGRAAQRAHVEPPDFYFDVRYPMGPAAWQRLIETAVHRIRRGELDKVVLARTCDVQVEPPVRPTDVLARLKRRYPDCYRFLIEPIPGHAFYGAPPELLVEVQASTIRTVAMAGSIGRGDSAEADAVLGHELMSSPKERQEHAFVVEAIEEGLRPLVRQLQVPEQPMLRRLHNIQHLQTVIQGELADGCGVLSAVEALHPTPAVGGVPRASALQMIAEREPVPRGWYASPVGWIDPRGNGCFSVAIRSAVSAGPQTRLYAGAGIVADSDPEREWDETGLKFRPMLDALRGANVGSEQ